MAKTNILVDLGAIKSGGGTQLALNFLEQLSRYQNQEDRFALIMPEVGPLTQSTLEQRYIKRVVSPNSYIRRLDFEYRSLPKILQRFKIEKVFTFFGSGLPLPTHIQSIVQVAYPIICYPDSQFWKHIAPALRIKTMARNFLRIRRLKRASRIIAETNVMRDRLCNVLGIEPDSVEVIPPAPSEYVRAQVKGTARSKKRFLFLSGNSSHKNLWRLYAVAQCLKSMNFKDFVFVITVSRNAYLAALRDSDLDDNLIDAHFHFLGSVHPADIMQVYDHADFACNFSDLESFSNNYMEAWVVGLPLLVSDRDFARNICGNSAVYVEPHDVQDVANKVIWVVRSQSVCEELVAKGKANLQGLPTQADRFSRVMDILDA